MEAKFFTPDMSDNKPATQTTTKKIKWRGWLIVFASACVLIQWIKFPVWTNRDETEDGTRIIETRSLFRTPIKRTLISDDFIMSGPFTNSGKRHGHWTFYFKSSGRYNESWYWYGEKVSEGRFHELNR